MCKQIILLTSSSVFFIYTFFLLNSFIPTLVYQYSLFFFFLPCLRFFFSPPFPLCPRSCPWVTLLEFLSGLTWQSICFLFRWKEGGLCALFFTSQPCRVNDKRQEMFLTRGSVGSDLALPTGGGVNTCICRAAECGACLLWLLPHSKRQTLPAV